MASNFATRNLHKVLAIGKDNLIVPRIQPQMPIGKVPLSYGEYIVWCEELGRLPNASEWFQLYQKRKYSER